jgi:hypothetical protein
MAPGNDPTALALLIEEQRRTRRSIQRLYRSVSALTLTVAQGPEKTRGIVREEMQGCPAHQHFDSMRSELGKSRGLADVQKEKIAAMQKEIDRMKHRGAKGKAIVISAPDKKTLVSAAVAAVLAAVGAVLAWLKAKG